VATVSRMGDGAMTDQHCAACGILLEEAAHMPGEPPGNGVCCSACLEEYPELRDMSRDEVTVWLYQRWGAIPGAEHNAAHVVAARAWLRVQARLGRDDDSMAYVAAQVYGVSKTTRPKLRRYVQELRERRQMAEAGVSA